jgi:hypothetical protein
MQYMKNQGILKYAFFRPNNKLDWNEMLATSLKNNSLKTLQNIVCVKTFQDCKSQQQIA